MTDIKLVDITLHIDQDTNSEDREFLEKGLRHIAGVVSVHMPSDKPHLVTVEYDPDKTSASHLREMAAKIVGHTELIGL